MSLMVHRIGLLRPSIGSPDAAAPGAFAADDWSVAPGDEEADVTIHALPDDGGATVTDIEYRLDGGSWVSSGGSSGFTISGLTNDQEYDVELRAVNSVGAGAASDTKQVTPEAEEPATFEEAVIALLGAKLRAFWLYDEPSHLWQDTSGTTPVANDSDPIGRVDDLSGNGKHLLQATSGNQPAYRTGPSRTSFDGVNDELTVASAAFPIDAFEYFHVIEQTAHTADWHTFTAFASTTGDAGARTDAFVLHLGQTTSLLSAQASEIAVTKSGSGLLPKCLVEYRQEASIATLLINGVSEGTDNSFVARSSPHPGPYVSGAGRNGSSALRWAPVDKWCEIIAAPLTSSERDDLHDLINARYSLW